jgi:hypothetical protein
LFFHGEAVAAVPTFRLLRRLRRQKALTRRKPYRTFREQSDRAIAGFAVKTPDKPPARGRED